MALYQKIEADMKDALRSGNAVKLSVMRMVIAALKLIEIERPKAPITDADVLQVIQKHIKQHKESIEQFTRGNRQDLVDKETSELSVLEAYMPAPLSDAELEKLVTETITAVGAATKADTGKVMKAALAAANGRADGKRISQFLATRLH